MKKDPDIVRWSQIKRYLIHFFWWFVVLGFFGWVLDVNRFNDNSLTSTFLLLTGLTIFMAFITFLEK